MAKKTIIVVEDDQDILEILNLILHEEYELFLFPVPPQNFEEFIVSKKPDIIIFDWLIPNTIVEDHIEPIRKKSPGTKIMIISAHNNVEKYFQDKDVDELLAKPFGVKALKKKIKGMLSKKRLPSADS